MRLWKMLRPWLARWLVHWDAAYDPESFPRYVQLCTLRNAQVGVLLMAITSLLWWPTDPFVFAQAPMAVAAFAFTRPVLTLLSLAGFVLFRAAQRRPRMAAPAVTLIAVLEAVVAGGAYSLLGGLDEGWFYFAFFLPFVGLLLCAGIVTRIWVTLLAGGAYPVAYFAVSPQHLQHPHAPAAVSFLVFVMAGAVLIGHVMYGLIRRNFMNQVTLEQRVRERTRRLEQLAGYLETSREDERRRVARELHDHTAQLLTGMRFELGTAQHDLEDAERLRAAFTRLEGLLDDAFAVHKEIIRQLHPRILDERGLGPALQWYVERFRERTGLPATYRAEGAVPEVPSDVALAAFRTVQEALTNVTRHARATQVEVCVRPTQGGLIIEVSDDGTGFRPQDMQENGFGLLSMRERAAAVGGTLVLDSRPGEGTRMRVELPVASASEVVPKGVAHQLLQGVHAKL